MSENGGDSDKKKGGRPKKRLAEDEIHDLRAEFERVTRDLVFATASEKFEAFNASLSHEVRLGIITGQLQIDIGTKPLTAATTPITQSSGATIKYTNTKI